MDKESQLPEFLQKRKGLQRRIDASPAEKANRSPKADSIIRLQSAGFWKRLLGALELTVKALREIDVTGSINPFGKEIVRVLLNDNSTPPVSTRIDLILDGDRIRCSVMNGGIYYLNFVAVSDTQIEVRDIQNDSDSLDARRTAEYVVDRMLNILEWTRAAN